jgi:hypothetical protein
VGLTRVLNNGHKKYVENIGDDMNLSLRKIWIVFRLILSVFKIWASLSEI